MIDAMAKKPLRVTANGKVGPYLMLPASQLEEVRQLLGDRGVEFAVDEVFVSMNGGPEAGFIDFGRKGDANRVQAILDGAS